MSELATVALQVTGKDAFSFLQNLLTNDLRRLESRAEILAAWCNPKGRVIWFGSLRKTEDGYALTAPADTAAEIMRRLATFRFRSKVDFALGDTGSINALELIRQGLPWISQQQAEKYTPHMLNLDILDAVSFDKGCYPGQEIVARTRYRGATRRRCLRFESSAPLPAGASVSDGTRDVGNVVNAVDTELLAVVPVDAEPSAFYVGTVRLKPASLPYDIR